jgi:hypothetical protein
MPLEFAAEVFVRFLFEAILYTLGYATGWLLVPTLSFGYYDVEPLSPPRRGAKRIRSKGTRRPRQLSAEATAMIGILFWAIVVAMGLAFWWFTRPN